MAKQTVKDKRLNERDKQTTENGGENRMERKKRGRWRRKNENENEEATETSGERACKGCAKRSTITVYILRSPRLIDLKPSRTRREWRDRSRDRDADTAWRGVAGSGVTSCRIGAANDQHRVSNERASEQARNQTIRMRERKREDKRKE